MLNRNQNYISGQNIDFFHRRCLIQMKKQSQGGLVAAFIGILVATIVGVGVAIPVVQDAILS